MNCFSTKIDLKLAEKLKNDLLQQGFEITIPPYTIFAAKKKGVSCNLYKSGSLTVQGKDMAAFIEFYLEPEILKEFTFTHPTATADLTPRIGVDEAGKGDFFGPLCTCAFYADKDDIQKLISLNIRDSKRMSDQTVLKIAKELEKSFTHDVICISPLKYNDLYQKMKNLNFLLGWAHATAIGNLVQKSSCKKVIIDQFASEYVVENALKKKNIEVDLTQQHRAESDVVVAAASIVARATFLKQLQVLSEKLGINLPKGASKLVLKTGKEIVQKFGAGKLSEYSKAHFKTTEDILNELK
ncbi:MAG: ribonuclease HIII [Chlamydiae bacterium CG10_big_fil_rev_8_21_14_0_10_35_9]|nr:MAG: ribonuclease HIII [Chlamydiae bacterium CG10_big_fil_rev_8_21_14_0_10_35_9]